MYTEEHLEKIKEEFRAFWAMENEKPLVRITGAADGYVPRAVKAPEKIDDRWLDGEYVLQSNLEKIRGTYYAGAAFPQIFPNFGPDILPAMLGCGLIFGEDTSWAVHVMKEDEWPSRCFTFDENNIWWKRLSAMTEYLARESRGRYFVGLSDLHPGCDALVSLRSPENLCYDVFGHGEHIRRANLEIFEVFRQIIDRSLAILSPYQEGSSTWMPIWHPGKWYVTSCDFICMISPEMFDKFITEELDRELEYLDASIFHLDGPIAFNNHLDKLLSFRKLKGVQLQYGAGATTARDWLKAAKKVQAAGKILNIPTGPEDLETLLSELKPQGLYLDLHKELFNKNGSQFSQSEVDAIMKRYFT